jgi:ABC-2 type transport system permease protein
MNELNGFRRMGFAATAVVAVGVLSAACSSPNVDGEGLQQALAPTFARLYQLQRAQQGDPRPSMRDLQPRAACDRTTPGASRSGPGNDWVCRVTFLVDGPGTPVTATYDVTLRADGCYAADGDGPTSVNGTQTIAGPDRRQHLNPLHLIDGCIRTG